MSQLRTHLFLYYRRFLALVFQRSPVLRFLVETPTNNSDIINTCSYSQRPGRPRGVNGWRHGRHVAQSAGAPCAGEARTPGVPSATLCRQRAPGRWWRFDALRVIFRLEWTLVGCDAASLKTPALREECKDHHEILGRRMVANPGDRQSLRDVVGLPHIEECGGHHRCLCGLKNTFVGNLTHRRLGRSARRFVGVVFRLCAMVLEESARPPFGLLPFGLSPFRLAEAG